MSITEKKVIEECHIELTYSLARCRPSGVRRSNDDVVLSPWLSTAPTLYKTFIAAFIESSEGGCGAWERKSLQFFAKELARICIQTSSNGHRLSSGSLAAFMIL